MRLSMGAIPYGAAAAFVLMSGSVAHGVGFQFFEGLPYGSAADSPFAMAQEEFDFFFNETFEDQTFDLPGLIIGAGELRAPSQWTDSVDGDGDGVFDGNGQSGWSYLHPSNVVLITFDANVHGTLPSVAGFAWTDGVPGTNATFEAYGAEDELLGSFDIVLGDAFYNGTTADDRFLGVQYEGGISAIRLVTDSYSMELDHIQYGGLGIPGPAGIAVFAGMLVAGRRRRRD